MGRGLNGPRWVLGRRDRGLKIKKLLGEMVVEFGFLVQNWVETCVLKISEIFFCSVWGFLGFLEGF